MADGPGRDGARARRVKIGEGIEREIEEEGSNFPGKLFHITSVVSSFIPIACSKEDNFGVQGPRDIASLSLFPARHLLILRVLQSEEEPEEEVEEGKIIGFIYKPLINMQSDCSFDLIYSICSHTAKITPFALNTISTRK